MKTRLWALILPATILFACRSNQEGSPSDVFIDSFSEESNTSFFEEVFSDIKVVPLDFGTDLTGANSSMSLRKSEGKFIITDHQTKTVYLFASDGSLITRVNKEGRGPGEYVELWAGDYSDHSLFVLGDGRLLEYSEAGEFVREHNFEKSVQDFCPLGDREFAQLIFCSGEDVEDRILISNTSDQIIQSFFLEEFMLYNYGAGLSKMDGRDEFLYRHAGLPRVDRCCRDSVITTYHFNLHGKEMPDGILKADDWSTMLDIMSNTPEIYYIASAFENDRYLLVALDFMIGSENESRIGQWLIDKNDWSSRIEYKDLDGPEFLFFGPPQMLTRDNEVVYICDATLFDTVKNTVPSLLKMEGSFQNCPSESILLFCKIK